MRALYIAVSAAIGQTRSSIVNADTGDGGNTRDAGMAETFGLVRENLFPGEKTIIWAHNRHIVHQESPTLSLDGQPVFIPRPMGMILKEEYPDELFTIGLYMLRGQTADNARNVLSVLPPRDNSIEAMAYSARLAALYFSTSGDQPQEEGNRFIFERTEAHLWGGEFGSYSIIP